MHTLRSILHRVELLPGAEIGPACSDLCHMAERLGVLCVTKFNDVRLHARPGDNSLRLVDAFYEVRHSGSSVKIAQVERGDVG